MFGTMKVLYLSYDGALDPLGRSQVIPYIEGLSRRGHRFHLLTFEKPARIEEREEVAAMRARLERAGVVWHPRRYHKRPPVLGTAWDIAVAALLARRIARLGTGLDLMHARSYPAALAARLAARRGGIPLLFDMRGLWAEERVDGGLWPPGGLLYATTKRVERDLLRDAAGVVTLTEASVPVVGELMAESGASETPLRVIPTCVDTRRFRPLRRSGGPPGGVEGETGREGEIGREDETGRDDDPADPGGGGRTARPDESVLAYVGSVGTWYMLREMLELGREWVRLAPGGRLLFLVNQGADEVRRLADEIGIPSEALELRGVRHEEVPVALAGVRATYFLIRPAPSKVASSPTKFGEALALGLPVLLNEGVGDAADVAREDRVGVVVRGFDGVYYRRAVRELLELLDEPGVPERCRRAAEARYALERGVEAYDAFYREIVAGRDGVGGGVSTEGGTG